LPASSRSMPHALSPVRLLWPRYPLHLFHFCCSSAAPGLHSFPTRRSSDLAARAEFARKAPAFGQLEPAMHVGREHDLVDLGHRPDRKSTRLNSSHVKISYAVFCLKKKRLASPRKGTDRPIMRASTASGRQP